MTTKSNFWILLLLCTITIQTAKSQEFKKTKFNLAMLNVAYLGIPNPILIYDFNAGDTIVGAGFKVFKREETHLIMPTKLTKVGTLYVLNSKKDTISQFKLRVLKLPKPTVSFLGMKEGLITARKLKSGKKLKAEINCPLDAKARVTSFTLTIVNGQTRTSTTFKSRNNKLSAKMKIALGKVQRGERVIFEDIKVKVPDGTTSNVSSIILKVK